MINQTYRSVITVIFNDVEIGPDKYILSTWPDRSQWHLGTLPDISSK